MCAGVLEIKLKKAGKYPREFRAENFVTIENNFCVATSSEIL